jgi:hypothetical protein
MAVRTTSAAVAGIIEVDSTISLTPFIEIANELVTECCDGAGYTDARLELIERWLAAHFYSVRDQRASSETAGRVSESKQTKVDLGFNVTVHGQQALRLDTAGGLAALDKRTLAGRKASVGVTWLGTDYDDEDEVVV